MFDRVLLIGSPARTRTADPMVNSHLLCQLSYWGLFRFLLPPYDPHGHATRCLIPHPAGLCQSRYSGTTGDYSVFYCLPTTLTVMRPDA
jgi:hypothetical protein